jgi:hypothetical protein
MPIGPITPGNYVTVTPDLALAQYASMQAPTATMGVTAADIQALTLIVINVQDFVLGEIGTTGNSKLDKIAGGVVSGDVEFSGLVEFSGAGINRPTFLGLRIATGELEIGSGASMSASGTHVFEAVSNTSFEGAAAFASGAVTTFESGSDTTFEGGSDTVFESTADVDFQGTGVNRPTFQGGLRVPGGELTLDAASSMSSSGTNAFGSGSDTDFSGTAVLRTSNGGKFRWDTRNKTDSPYTADGTNGYEDILPDPAANRSITLANTGAAQGQRKKFNAQKVTGANHWVIGYGARSWFLRNVAANTVKIEFVFDGSGWVVDDWEEGGVGLRDG